MFDHYCSEKEVLVDAYIVDPEKIFIETGVNGSVDYGNYDASAGSVSLLSKKDDVLIWKIQGDTLTLEQHSVIFKQQQPIRGDETATSGVTKRKFIFQNECLLPQIHVKEFESSLVFLLASTRSIYRIYFSLVSTDMASNGSDVFSLKPGATGGAGSTTNRESLATAASRRISRSKSRLLSCNYLSGAYEVKSFVYEEDESCSSQRPLAASFWHHSSMQSTFIISRVNEMVLQIKMEPNGSCALVKKQFGSAGLLSSFFKPSRLSAGSSSLDMSPIDHSLSSIITTHGKYRHYVIGVDSFSELHVIAQEGLHKILTVDLIQYIPVSPNLGSSKPKHKLPPFCSPSTKFSCTHLIKQCISSAVEGNAASTKQGQSLPLLAVYVQYQTNIAAFIILMLFEDSTSIKCDHVCTLLGPGGTLFNSKSNTERVLVDFAFDSTHLYALWSTGSSVDNGGCSNWEMKRISYKPFEKSDGGKWQSFRMNNNNGGFYPANSSLLNVNDAEDVNRFFLNYVMSGVFPTSLLVHIVDNYDKREKEDDDGVMSTAATLTPNRNSSTLTIQSRAQLERRILECVESEITENLSKKQFEIEHIEYRLATIEHWKLFINFIHQSMANNPFDDNAADFDSNALGLMMNCSTDSSSHSVSENLKGVILDHSRISYIVPSEVVEGTELSHNQYAFLQTGNRKIDRSLKLESIDDYSAEVFCDGVEKVESILEEFGLFNFIEKNMSNGGCSVSATCSTGKVYFEVIKSVYELIEEGTILTNEEGGIKCERRKVLQHLVSQCSSSLDSFLKFLNNYISSFSSFTDTILRDSEQVDMRFGVGASATHQTGSLTEADDDYSLLLKNFTLNTSQNVTFSYSTQVLRSIITQNCVAIVNNSFRNCSSLALLTMYVMNHGSCYSNFNVEHALHQLCKMLHNLVVLKFICDAEIDGDSGAKIDSTVNGGGSLWVLQMDEPIKKSKSVALSSENNTPLNRAASSLFSTAERSTTQIDNPELLPKNTLLNDESFLSDNGSPVFTTTSSSSQNRTSQSNFRKEQSVNSVKSADIFKQGQFVLGQKVTLLSEFVASNCDITLSRLMPKLQSINNSPGGKSLSLSSLVVQKLSREFLKQLSNVQLVIECSSDHQSEDTDEIYDEDDILETAHWRKFRSASFVDSSAGLYTMALYFAKNESSAFSTNANVVLQYCSIWQPKNSTEPGRVFFNPVVKYLQCLSYLQCNHFENAFVCANSILRRMRLISVPLFAQWLHKDSAFKVDFQDWKVLLEVFFGISIGIGTTSSCGIDNSDCVGGTDTDQPVSLSAAAKHNKLYLDIASALHRLQLNLLTLFKDNNLYRHCIKLSKSATKDFVTDSELMTTTEQEQCIETSSCDIEINGIEMEKFKLNTLRFECGVHLSDYQECYDSLFAMKSNKVAMKSGELSERFRDLLKCFVECICVDEDSVRTLCKFTCLHFENDLINVLQHKCRFNQCYSEKDYYYALYKFHNSRKMYRNGAMVMLEKAFRIRRELLLHANVEDVLFWKKLLNAESYSWTWCLMALTSCEEKERILLMPLFEFVSKLKESGVGENENTTGESTFMNSSNLHVTDRCDESKKGTVLKYEHICQCHVLSTAINTLFDSIAVSNQATGFGVAVGKNKKAGKTNEGTKIEEFELLKSIYCNIIVQLDENFNYNASSALNNLVAKLVHFGFFDDAIRVGQVCGLDLSYIFEFMTELYCAYSPLTRNDDNNHNNYHQCRWQHNNCLPMDAVLVFNNDGFKLMFLLKSYLEKFSTVKGKRKYYSVVMESMLKKQTEPFPWLLDELNKVDIVKVSEIYLKYGYLFQSGRAAIDYLEIQINNLRLVGDNSVERSRVGKWSQVDIETPPLYLKVRLFDALLSLLLKQKKEQEDNCVDNQNSHSEADQMYMELKIKVEHYVSLLKQIQQQDK